MNHPLLNNPWALHDEPEHGEVRLSYIHRIDRARSAIQIIARLVGNSASEPDATGAIPLDGYAVTCLMGGVESLCDQLEDLTEELLSGSRQIREWRAAQDAGVLK